MIKLYSMFRSTVGVLEISDFDYANSAFEQLVEMHENSPGALATYLYEDGKLVRFKHNENADLEDSE